MLPEKKTKANIGVGIGCVIQLAGLFLFGPEDIRAIVLILLSLPVFIWGCMNYAEGKGHSKWVGLVGLAGIIGLIVLIVLPDQHKGGGIGVRLVGCISMLAGFALVFIGLYLWNLSEGPWDIRLERRGTVCMLLGACLVVGSLVLLCTDFGRSKPRPSQARDEQIAAGPQTAPLDLPPDAPSSPVEAYLGPHRRRPLAVAGVVENGLVRPLDPAVSLPEHSRVIIVTTEGT